MDTRNDAEQQWAVLSRIASVLGVPVERFNSDPLSAEVILSADECLRLWSLITTDKGRRQALGVLKAIADLEQT